MLSEEARLADGTVADPADVLLAHGEALARAGDPAGAAEAFRRAIVESPDGETAPAAALGLFRLAATDRAIERGALGSALSALAQACAEEPEIATAAGREGALSSLAAGVAVAPPAAGALDGDMTPSARADTVLWQFLAGVRGPDPAAAADGLAAMAASLDESAGSVTPEAVALSARARGTRAAGGRRGRRAGRGFGLAAHAGAVAGAGAVGPAGGGRCDLAPRASGRTSGPGPTGRRSSGGRFEPGGGDGRRAERRPDHRTGGLRQRHRHRSQPAGGLERRASRGPGGRRHAGRGAGAGPAGRAGARPPAGRRAAGRGGHRLRAGRSRRRRHRGALPGGRAGSREPVRLPERAPPVAGRSAGGRPCRDPGGPAVVSAGGGAALHRRADRAAVRTRAPPADDGRGAVAGCRRLQPDLEVRAGKSRRASGAVAGRHGGRRSGGRLALAGTLPGGAGRGAPVAAGGFPQPAEADETIASARLALAGSYEGKGDVASAVATLRRAAKVSPADPRPLDQLAELLAPRGRRARRRRGPPRCRRPHPRQVGAGGALDSHGRAAARPGRRRGGGCGRVSPGGGSRSAGAGRGPAGRPVRRGSGRPRGAADRRAGGLRPAACAGRRSAGPRAAHALG